MEDCQKLCWNLWHRPKLWVYGNPIIHHTVHYHFKNIILAWHNLFLTGPSSLLEITPLLSQCSQTFNPEWVKETGTFNRVSFFSLCDLTIRGSSALFEEFPMPLVQTLENCSVKLIQVMFTEKPKQLNIPEKWAYHRHLKWCFYAVKTVQV